MSFRIISGYYHSTPSGREAVLLEISERITKIIALNQPIFELFFIFAVVFSVIMEHAIKEVIDLHKRSAILGQKDNVKWTGDLDAMRKIPD